MTRNNKVLVSFKDVSLGYGKRIILEDLNLEISQGDFLGIIGPNGSGKTTLLNSILGIFKPITGTIKSPPSGIRFGYVIQRQFIDDIFPLTAKEIVSMGRYGLVGPFKRFRKNDWMHVEGAMEIAGISGIGAQSYHNLSGGQKQRVLIARAIASEANILILDEPTNDMDIKGEAQIMELIKKIHAERDVTVVIVSHLLHNIINYVDTLAFIKDARLIIQPINDAVSGGCLSNIFDCSVNVGQISGKKVIVYGNSNNRDV